MKMSKVPDEAKASKEEKQTKDKFECSNAFCPHVYTNECTLKRHMKFQCTMRPHFKCFYCELTTHCKFSIQRHFTRQNTDLPAKYLDLTKSKDVPYDTIIPKCYEITWKYRILQSAGGKKAKARRLAGAAAAAAAPKDKERETWKVTSDADPMDSSGTHGQKNFYLVRPDVRKDKTIRVLYGPGPRCRHPGQRILCPNDNCDRRYMNNAGLKRHLQFECQIERKFRCAFCDYITHYVSNIKKHSNVWHKNVVPSAYYKIVDGTWIKLKAEQMIDTPMNDDKLKEQNDLEKGGTWSF